MSPAGYTIRQCMHPKCGLRYPYVMSYQFGERCPRCRGETQIVKHQKRFSEPVIDHSQIRDPMFEILVDNVRSVWNVGSIFRTAEGFGVSKIHLCGISPTPENPKLKKTALGSELLVPWQYYANGVTACQGLKSEGAYLLGLETTQDATFLEIMKVPSLNRWALIVGNENCGIDPDILALCDQLIHISMHGKKRSLNVAVAAGVALNHLRQL